MEDFTVRDQWLARIAHRIHEELCVHEISFEVCEDSLETLNQLADEICIGIPELEAR